NVQQMVATINQVLDHTPLPIPFLFRLGCDHRNLHSFPTRRSSDLGRRRTTRCVPFSRGRNHCRNPRRRGAAWLRRNRSARTSSVDRKSTRLNSSHVKNSYAVFCLKKKSTGASLLQDVDKMVAMTKA